MTNKCSTRLALSPKELHKTFQLLLDLKELGIELLKWSISLSIKCTTTFTKRKSILQDHTRNAQSKLSWSTSSDQRLLLCKRNLLEPSAHSSHNHTRHTINQDTLEETQDKDQLDTTIPQDHLHSSKCKHQSSKCHISHKCKCQASHKCKCHKSHKCTCHKSHNSVASRTSISSEIKMSEFKNVFNITT